MEKVRFSCPRCSTMMQTAAEKVGNEVECPNCAHRFRLVESDSPSVGSTRAYQDDLTMPPSRGIEKSSTPSPVSSGSTTPYPSQAVAATSSAPAPVYRQTYSCPYCQTKIAPDWKSEVSTVGWIVFAILFCTTCVGCFVGLFIRDKYRVCSQCKIRLG